jgi:thiosulfate reductase/polysulfide reductase chain A
MKTRRDFIKISTLGLGGIAAAAGLSRIAMGSSVVDDLLKLGAAGSNSFKRSPTYCEVCFWKCAAWAYTDDKGKLLKVIGNDDDPHCYGRLCPRGTGGIGMYNDQDRLQKPLIRVPGVDADTFREASWE